MKYVKKIIFILGILFSINACKPNKDELFNEIYSLIEQENFFKTKELYDSYQNDLSETYQNFTEAILNNAFNRLEKSEKKIDYLLKNKNSLPDSLKYELYAVHKDNSLKLFNYKEAKNAVTTILKEYNEYLTEKELVDYENSLKIWTALENVPPQKVVIKQSVILKMEKDIAGLKNLKVSANCDTLNFIFDTGANLSTTTQSVAERLKMKIIPVNIKVGSITGVKVLAQLAICEKLILGNIDIYNAVFLVMPDKELTWPQANYQIYGVLGFPVIEALKEIKITQDDKFIVPKKESTFTGSSNLAMNGLMPLIYIDGKHFGFDTGADNTMLYHKFYKENKEQIDKQYELQKINFGGAGGNVEFDGYMINQTFNILGKEITLKNISLVKGKIKDDETTYGNIGQDLIQQFDTMTLNFDKMFIKFD